MSRKHYLRAALLATVSVGATVVNAQNQPRNQSEPVSHTLEGYVSEDALQVMYGRELDLDEVGRTEVTGGIFFNEDRDLIMMGGALSRIGRPTDVRRLTLQVGPRMYGALLNTENDDIFGVGLGGEARYYLDTDRTTAVALTAFYAPDILVFGNADNVTDVSLRFEAGLRTGTQIFVGYRVFELDMAVDREVDDNLHIGFRRDF